MLTLINVRIELNGRTQLCSRIDERGVKPHTSGVRSVDVRVKESFSLDSHHLKCPSGDRGREPQPAACLARREGP